MVNNQIAAKASGGKAYGYVLRSHQLTLSVKGVA